MPTDPRKRQQKQERRAAKRKAKQREVAREKHAGLAERMAAAARYPILTCWVTPDIWDQGLGQVCLSRELPQSHVAFAVFLVDRYCLGVKNAMAEITPRSKYESRIERDLRARFAGEAWPPAAARKLVEEAIRYARGLGFHPHPDYHRASPLFGDINPAECHDDFEFGKDGKPYFIAGPDDTPERCRQILRTLEQSCGPGGYHFLIPALPETEELPFEEGG